jgi:hypothetical protein
MEPTPKIVSETPNTSPAPAHPFDLESLSALDLFAEEGPAPDEYELMPPNTFSTLACECETVSTFFCYGCGTV